MLCLPSSARRWCAVAALLVAGTVFGHRPLAATEPVPPKLEVDDRPEFRSKTARGEEAEDRLSAASLYLHGRLLFQREDYAGALRRYQRAWRYEPSVVAILGEIVPLAVSANRPSEAARYAVIAANDSQDAELLVRLGIYLTEKQDWGQAVRLYEKARDLRKNERPNPSLVVLHLEIGRLHFLEGDFGKSAGAFAYVREALDDPKKHGLDDAARQKLLGRAERTYTLMGEAFLQAERFGEAEAMFAKAHALEKSDATWALFNARVAQKRKDVDAALTRLDEYFATKSSDGGTEPYEMLEKLLTEKLGAGDGAKEFLRRLDALAKADAANTPLAYTFAAHLLQLELWADAEKQYVQLQKRKVTGDSLRGLLTVYHRQKDVPKLLDTLAKGVATAGNLKPFGKPGEEVTQDAELGHKLRQVHAKRREAKSVQPGEALAIASLSLAQKQLDAADEAFGRALADAGKKQKGELVTSWGLELFLADEYARAIRVFRRAIDEKLLSDDQQLHFYLAGALEMDGKTDDALATVKAALARDPDSISVRNRWAWIQYHAKRYADAERAYRELLDKFDGQHDSDDVRETLREVRLVLSNICVHLERLPEAEEWLEQVLDEFPDHVGAKNDLGYLWADQNKRLKRALTMIEAAVAEEPDNHAYRDSLGWVYYRMGRFDEAVKELEQAAADKDADGVIFDHLGDAYLKANQGMRAVATWERAAQAFRAKSESKFLSATEAKIKQFSTERK